MKRILYLLLLFYLSFTLYSNNNLTQDSKSVHPLLDSVILIHEDENYRYRALIYSGGYEHLSSFIVIQKFSVNYDSNVEPYNFISSTEISEINKIYNFNIEQIIKNADGFTIILNAFHSYLFQETIIEIKLFDDLNYIIESGLIEIY